MVEKSKVNKHIQVSKDLYNKFLDNTNGVFETQTKGFEYFLEMGMNYDETRNKEEKLLYDLNYCIKEISYIKKLLEQLFVNKRFPDNQKINDDKCLKDFKKNIYKDDFND